MCLQVRDINKSLMTLDVTMAFADIK